MFKKLKIHITYLVINYNNISLDKTLFFNTIITYENILSNQLIFITKF